MPEAAGPDETDRDAERLRVARALVIVAASRTGLREPIAPNEHAAPLVLADEPRRKLQHLDSHALAWGAIIARRRFHERARLGQPAPLCLKSRGERITQARLEDRMLLHRPARPLAPIPEVEASNEHRVVEQVERRAGPVRRHSLALTNRSVRPVCGVFWLAGHAAAPASSRRRHQLRLPSESPGAIHK